MDEKPKKPLGAKKKADRLITGEIALDLNEAKTSVMNFWVQKSLKDAFVQACQRNAKFPLVPADVLRQFMVEFIDAHNRSRRHEQFHRLAVEATFGSKVEGSAEPDSDSTR